VAVFDLLQPASSDAGLFFCCGQKIFTSEEASYSTDDKSDDCT
jgi:hypothetical protein